MRRAMGAATWRLSRGFAPLSQGGVSSKSHRRRRPRDEAAAPRDSVPRSAGRFAHRHGQPPPSRAAPAPASSRTALVHLLGVHASLRSNYESLQHSERVLASFSNACAEALLQSGIVYRAGTRGPADGAVAVTTAAAGTAGAPPLAISANSPLLVTPIAFPPPPLADLIAAPRVMSPATHTDSGELLLAEMEGDGEGVAAAAAPGPEKKNNIDRDNRGDAGVEWEASFSEGVAEAFEMLRETPSGDVVQLLDTLAHFKWAKDEAMFEWQRDGAARCAEIAALQRKDTATPPTSTTTTTVAGAELDRVAESLIARIPRADPPNASTMDVLDLMLNVLMRVCVWRWPQLSFYDQCTVFLMCSFPWFARDLRTEAALWTTYSHLRLLWDKDTNSDYKSAFVLIQRLRRLGWMTVHDTDSAIVRRLFGGDIKTAVNKKKSEKSNQSEDQNHHPMNETSDMPFFRDVVYVLYGNRELQQVAYEILLLWMTHAHPSQLHRATVHSRYIGAIGIALSDVDRFLTPRYHDRHRAGEWLLLNRAAREMSGGCGESIVTTLTRDSATPYLLTRLYFCNYHTVLPAIWQYVSSRRRELLWGAWRRAVAQPLSDISAADPRFVHPVMDVLRKNRAFCSLLTHVAVAELRSIAGIEGSREHVSESSPGNAVEQGGGNAKDTSADTVELCARLVDAAHTCALLLQSDSIDDSEAIAMRSRIAAATRAVLPRLCMDDRALVESLHASLFSPRGGLLGPALARLCDAATCGAVDEWLRRADAAEETDNVEEEPFEESFEYGESKEICEWLQVARGVDVGLASTRLPSLVECCRSAAAAAQCRAPPQLTLRELRATLTAAARAGLRGGSGSGSGNGTGTVAALRRVSFADAGESAAALIPLLTAACAARAEKLPLAARLEAVLLRLAPLEALAPLQSSPRAGDRQFERTVRAARHPKRVAHVVFMRHYARAESGDATARALMEVLVRAEMAPGAVSAEEPEALDTVLACHALAAYARIATGRDSSLSATAVLPLRDVFARLLDHAEAFCRAPDSPRGDSDTVLLWIVATARAAGVHVSAPPERESSAGVGGGSTVVQAEGLGARASRVFLAVLRVAEAEVQRMGARPRLSFIARVLIAARDASDLFGCCVDIRFLSAATAVQRGFGDRRLLRRCGSLLLSACAALPPLDGAALLAVAAPLRDARDALAPPDVDAAFVAVARAAEALARQHEAHSNAEPTQANAQLRHAWSALARRVLADGAPAPLAVRAVECASAVACVDTRVCQQIMAAVVVLHSERLSIGDWAALLRAARHATEARRALENCMRQPLRLRIESLVKDTNSARTMDRGQRLRDVCMLVEALPDMFVGDTEFWALLRKALRVQWNVCAGEMPAETQQAWLREMAQSYEWAARSAGHHELSQLPIA